MKKIIVFIFLVLYTTSYSQQDSVRTLEMEPDSVCFSAEQVIRIDKEIRTMKLQLTYSSALLLEYEHQMKNYERVISLDSMAIYNLNQKNALLQQNIDLLNQQLLLTKPKWYENQYLNLGIGLVLGGLIVAL